MPVFHVNHSKYVGPQETCPKLLSQPNLWKSGKQNCETIKSHFFWCNNKCDKICNISFQKTASRALICFPLEPYSTFTFSCITYNITTTVNVSF
ncbi:hypothetical protein GDO78_017799 [Eleutherodactylus coqui]|uniref:Uncharacterized protein n=1 Tax=Eleutherodactylus coqui TaxID=57060 RepID=A0A8J6BQN3_ELECQ|nr:hypothetical protein GDO78_017799 [Eleutherodactylus coqui]